MTVPALGDYPAYAAAIHAAWLRYGRAKASAGSQARRDPGIDPAVARFRAALREAVKLLLRPKRPGTARRRAARPNPTKAAQMALAAKLAAIDPAVPEHLRQIMIATLQAKAARYAPRRLRH